MSTLIDLLRACLNARQNLDIAKSEARFSFDRFSQFINSRQFFSELKNPEKELIQIGNREFALVQWNRKDCQKTGEIKYFPEVEFFTTS